jgi:CubicO group peptidase (beta-lactamase class C family)
MRRSYLAAVAAGAAVAAVAALLAPQPHELAGERATGDPAAVAALRAAAGSGRGHDTLAAVVVEGGRVRYAGLGADERTPFEIGSVTKALTGMLLADLVAAGTVRPDDTLAQTMPDVRFADPAVGRITLAQLAGHRSGLPRLPADLLWRGLGALGGQSPYAGVGPDRVRDWGARASAGTPDRFAYSNLGTALLGQALAARTGIAYPDLLRQRILTRLGMADTVVLADGAAPPPGAATGATASGRPMQPWTGPGFAPAGIGVWSTAGDLGRLLVALLAGTAPGAAAADPVADADADRDGVRSRIGYGWFTTATRGGPVVTWHNGGTGGFRAYAGFDRAAGRAVAVLGNTDRPVDPIGLRLLGGRPGQPEREGLALVVATLVLLAYPLNLLLLARRRAPGERWRPMDRLAVVGGVAWAVVGLLLAHRVGAWLTVPALLWPLAAGGGAAGAVLLALRWRELPTAARRRRWLRWAWVTGSTTLAAGVVAATTAVW